MAGTNYSVQRHWSVVHQVWVYLDVPQSHHLIHSISSRQTLFPTWHYFCFGFLLFHFSLLPFKYSQQIHFVWLVYLPRYTDMKFYIYWIPSITTKIYEKFIASAMNKNPFLMTPPSTTIFVFQFVQENHISNAKQSKKKTKRLFIQTKQQQNIITEYVSANTNPSSIQMLVWFNWSSSLWNTINKKP